MAAPIITFEHVGKVYGEAEALVDFSLNVFPGEFLTVIGTSGSGKTTFLKMINGLIAPDSGRVEVEGEDIAQVDLIALRRRIGYTIQGVGLFPHMTVAQNIVYVPDLSGLFSPEEKRAQIERLLTLVGLEQDLAGRYPGELSGGQRQRVGIARALAANPHILLMDEPFGAVDEITRRRLQREIKAIHGELEVTIIFITHDIREALKLGDRVAVMDEGCLVQLDTPEALRQAPATPFVAELLGDEGNG